MAAKYNGLWFFAVFVGKGSGGENDCHLIHKNIVVTPEAIAGLPEEVIAFGSAIGFAVYCDRANLEKVCAENVVFEDSIRNGWHCLNDEFSVINIQKKE